MANQIIIDQCLNMFANTYNKSSSWTGSVRPLWEVALEQMNDKDVWMATINVCKEIHQYPPTIANIVKEVEKIVKESGRQGIGIVYNMCNNCIHRDGIVDTVVHYTWLSGVDVGKNIVSQRICRCTCDGASKKYPSIMSYTKREDLLHDDPRIDVTYWNYTTPTTPYLTIEETDPKYWVKVLENRKIKRDQSNNPFMKLVDVLQDMIVNKEPIQENLFVSGDDINRTNNDDYNYNYDDDSESEDYGNTGVSSDDDLDWG